MSQRCVWTDAPTLEDALWPALLRLGLEPVRDPADCVVAIVTPERSASAAVPVLTLGDVPPDEALQRDLWRICPALQTMTLGPAAVDLGRRRVRLNDVETRLSPTEVRLLCWMRGRRGQVVLHAELLAEVWGYSPKVQTRTVTATMHRLRAKLELDPKAPRVLLTEPGGYRLELAPTPAADVFGRDPIVAALWADDAPGLVTLVGVGGVGKSTVLRAALEVRPSDQPEPIIVDLDGAHSAHDIRGRVAQAVGVHLGSDGAQSLSDALGELRARLVLDHAEGCGNLLRGVLANWPLHTLCLWVGSRTALGHPGERVHRLGGLAATDARALLLSRARSRREDWDASDVDALVACVHGLPLALELAAAQARILDADQVVRRLRDLGDLSVADGGRHASLHAVLRESLEMLDTHARRVLAGLCTFAGPVDVRTAERVLGGEVLPALDLLVALALVHRQPDGRLQVLHPIRGVVGDAPDLAPAIATWLLDDGGPLEEWLAAVERTEGQTRAALVAGAGRHLAEAGAYGRLGELLDATAREQLTPDIGAELALLDARRVVESGDPASALRQLTALVDSPSAVEARLLAAELSLDLGDPGPVDAWMTGVPAHGVSGVRSLLCSAGAAFLSGEHEVAEALYAEAVEGARPLGDDRLLSTALFSASVVPFVRGCFPQMEAVLTEAVACATGHPLRRALAGHRLGIALHRLERVDEAVAAMREAEEVCRAAGLGRTTVAILSDLGGVLAEQGADAEATIRRAVFMARRFSLPLFEQTSLINLATVQANRGAFALATGTLDTLRETLDRSPRDVVTGAYASLRGSVCHGRGDLDEALRWLSEAAAGLEATGHRNRTPMIWARRAWILGARGDAEGARGALDMARARVGEGERSMQELLEAFVVRTGEALGEDMTRARRELLTRTRGRHRVQVLLQWQPDTRTAES